MEYKSYSLQSGNTQESVDKHLIRVLKSEQKDLFKKMEPKEVKERSF